MSARRTPPINFASVKLVSWDVDGTLYSITRLKLELFRKLLRESVAGRGSVAMKELAALRRYQGMIEARRSASDETQMGRRRDGLRDIEKRWYGDAIRRVGPRAGVKDLIAFFGTNNVPQVLVTDYLSAYKLDMLELSSYFSAAYEGESLGFVKPSPKAFEQIASDFRLPLESILHIGDRVDTDRAAARAAGCQCLILGRDFQSFESFRNSGAKRIFFA